MSRASTPSKILLGLIFLLSAQSASAVPIGSNFFIELLPNSSTALPGDSVSLDLFIDGLNSGSPASLGAFDIDVTYDPTALSYTGNNFDSFLGDPFLDAISGSADTGGLLNLFEISFLFDFELDALQPSRFRLTTLNFDVNSLASGVTTDVSIGPFALLSDSFGNNLIPDSVGNATLTGSMAPVAVPEPSMLSLMGLSLFLLVMFRRNASLTINKNTNWHGSN